MLAYGSRHGYAIAMTDVIFRIAAPEDFASAALSGQYEGAAHDKADGFIHASTKAQLGDTLALHYGDYDRVAIAEIATEKVKVEIKWEPSRGGSLFPHIYGNLNWDAVVTVHLVKKDEDGHWRLSSELMP
jgi:beta-hydroxylase